jgi:hypothetical protein
MIIHVTPVHLQALALVREDQITWRTQTGPHGGFGLADGTRIAPGNELVALYELRNAGLITVDKLAGRVAITAVGLTRLARHRPANPQEMRPAS